MYEFHIISPQLVKEKAKQRSKISCHLPSYNEWLRIPKVQTFFSPNKYNWALKLRSHVFSGYPLQIYSEIENIVIPKAMVWH